MTETAQDFQKAQLTVSDHQPEGRGCRVWGMVLGPDARRAMTGCRDNTAWVRDLSGSSPREKNIQRRGRKPDTRVSADAALSLVLPCYADPAPC